jgi:type VI secretion system ImpM family protein
MKAATLGLPGVLGKHPTRGDFFSAGNRDPEFLSFDAFLTHNIEWAEAKAGPSWIEAYNAGNVQAFVYRSTSSNRSSALVGVFAPSWDRAGRRFPLTVAVPLAASQALLASPEVLPLALESIWQSTSELLLSFTSAPDTQIEFMPNPMGNANVLVDDAFDGYASWTRSLPSSELWSLIFSGNQRVDPVKVLSLISKTVATCRGIERPTTPLALRLPLGAAGGASLCFWLDWVCRIARWKTTIPSFFWSHDGREGAVVIALGSPPPCTLAELWSTTGSRDQICDVATAPWQLENVNPTDPVAVALGKLAKHHTVAELLHAAHTIDV